MFNETITEQPSAEEYGLTFTCSGYTYTLLLANGAADPNNYAFSLEYQTPPFVPEIVYNYVSDGTGEGWYSESYRTITITDTSSLTNREEFTTWFKANATKQDVGGASN